MFINSVDWAAEQEDLLNITPREPTPRTFIPPTQWQIHHHDHHGCIRIARVDRICWCFLMACTPQERLENGS